MTINLSNKSQNDDLSVSTYGDWEEYLSLRDSISRAELERLSGAPTYTVEEVRIILKEKYGQL